MARTVIGRDDSAETDRVGAAWKRVASALRTDIHTQKMQPGQQLPTEIDLADHFGVSRSTIRRALAQLQQEGLVRIQHGRGIFVAEDVVQYTLGQRTRFSENMERFNLSGERRLLSSSIEEADPVVRRNLELSHGADVIVIESVSEISQRPLGIARVYYPAARFPGLDSILQTDSSRTRALRQFGIVDYRRKTTRIITRLPTTQEANLLRIVRTRPILQTEKIDVDLEGRPISYGIVCYGGDRIQLVVGETWPSPR